jgi:hypothetical protein
MCVLLIAVIVLGVLSASARSAEPLPVASVSPVDGATLPIASKPIAFEWVNSNPEQHFFQVRVVLSTQSPPVGSDGLLTDFTADVFALFNSEAEPTIFRGQSNYVANGSWWNTKPGTYYWQIMATSLPPSFVSYLSPVYTLTIAAPPPPAPPAAAPRTPPISLEEAYAAVKEIIWRQTRLHPHHLSSRCSLPTEDEANCAASWASTLRPAATALLYAGRFRLWQEGEHRYFSFSGLREREGCARHYGAKRCATRVRW